MFIGNIGQISDKGKQISSGKYILESFPWSPKCYSKELKYTEKLLNIFIERNVSNEKLT